MIRAAGGLVWRPGRHGGAEVCLIHRPRYDDWSLPKGTLEPGEHPLAAAVREVAEETGARARPLRPLPDSRYLVDGKPKVVRYWVMSVVTARRFQPRSEVDSVAWLPVSAAARRLSYRSDTAVLDHWRGTPPVSGVVLLVRHALASGPGEWHGPDRGRPLAGSGAGDAAALCRLLSLFAPEALMSASPRRCVQTLAPLAAESGLPVEVVRSFDQGPADPDGAVAQLLRAAAERPATVACTHGTVIRAVLARLTGMPDAWETGKADGWLVPFSGSSPLPPAPLAVRS